MMISTPNLKLIPCELKHFEAILKSPNELEHLLGVTVPDNWFDFPGVSGIEAIRFAYEHLKKHPDVLGWWTYLIVHVEDGVLVGQGGYKGPADEAGMVEIGYAIISAYRGRGVATEAARGLLDHAFAHRHIKSVDAHTLAEQNGSTRVLEKVGMFQDGSAHDPDAGEVWHWTLRRGDYEKA